MITDNHHPTLRFLKKLCSSFSLTVWCYGPSLYCPKTTRNVDSSDHSTIFLVASVHLEGARARGSWLRLLMFWMYGFLLCMLDLTCIYSDNVCLRLSCSDILNENSCWFSCMGTLCCFFFTFWPLTRFLWLLWISGGEIEYVPMLHPCLFVTEPFKNQLFKLWQSTCPSGVSFACEGLQGQAGSHKLCPK